jgi:CheY-like chemotaxis protein
VKSFDLVYIIEDDLITSKITELHLHQHGGFGKVKKFVNGEPALHALLDAAAQPAQLPDLILLDLNMPVMDGWEFLDAFTAHHWRKAVDVCVLTSSIQPEDIAKARSYKEVKGYFSKPVDNGLLDRMVELLA